MAGVISTGLAWATASSRSSSTLVGRGTFEPFKILRKGENNWDVKVEGKDGLDVVTQTITFQVGGQSGWHSHPGPVFITVKEGTMTFYEADCSASVRTAGEGFLDTGAHPHLARNESGAPATNVVTYFVPRGAPVRIDEPAPPTCPI